jgi:hypothetical protein
LTQTEIINQLAEKSGLKKAQAKEFFTALAALASSEVKKNGEFTVPSGNRRRYQDSSQNDCQIPHRQSPERYYRRKIIFLSKNSILIHRQAAFWLAGLFLPDFAA